MRILVIGGDAFQDPRAVFVLLDDLCIAHCKANPVEASISARAPRFELIYPDGSRAGEIADLWSRKRGVMPKRWPALSWREFNPSILTDGAPDLIVAYPGYPRWLVRKAAKRGIRCVEAT